MMQKTFYLTTPIYYVNDAPHIGHAYTTIAADVLARYKRMSGYNVFFLTGTDEHGRKVEKAAQETAETPIQLADRVMQRFQDLWERLAISHDDFIRTSEARHQEAVQKFFKIVADTGDIYLGEYEDWYCVSCESFWTDKQLIEGRCPNAECQRPVEKLKEESYFFKMSKYQKPLLRHLKENPHFVRPESRYNEIVSFVKEGLRDLSISRTSFSWGIPVPDNPKHVIYVWFDALLNYVSAIDYFSGGETFQAFWPADVHMIGKDILRFHAVYWPTFLMSAGLPLPKNIFAHGWWTIEGKKMSKSLGNAIDPYALTDQYGVDSLRYFLMREATFGIDGDFSHQAMINRINSDLANDLGNLFSRAIAMMHKYFEGTVPRSGSNEAIDDQLRDKKCKVLRDVDGWMNELAFHRALTSIWELISMVNKYIDETAPWALAKDLSQRERLGTIMVHIIDSLRTITLLLAPFMPLSCEKMWFALGSEGDLKQQKLELLNERGIIKPGTKIQKIPPLFPRIQS
jgi:methionyl-tRNA synthetase